VGSRRLAELHRVAPRGRLIRDSRPDTGTPTLRPRQRPYRLAARRAEGPPTAGRRVRVRAHGTPSPCLKPCLPSPGALRAPASPRGAPLRGARQYGRWRGRWEGSMESAEQAWTSSPAPLKPGRSGPGELNDPPLTFLGQPHEPPGPSCVSRHTEIII
jgi:hypothetical protein